MHSICTRTLHRSRTHCVWLVSAVDWLVPQFYTRSRFAGVWIDCVLRVRLVGLPFVVDFARSSLCVAFGYAVVAFTPGLRTVGCAVTFPRSDADYTVRLVVRFYALPFARFTTQLLRLHRLIRVYRYV